MGGGGISVGIAWNCLRIDPWPILISDALPEASFLGCSTLLPLWFLGLEVDFFLPGKLNDCIPLHRNGHELTCNSKREACYQFFWQTHCRSFATQALLLWKWSPTMLLSTLKKHSTSSVELARGCSRGMFSEMHRRLIHSLLSIVVVRAMSVSLDSPLRLLYKIESPCLLQNRIPNHHPTHNYSWNICS